MGRRSGRVLRMTSHGDSESQPKRARGGRGGTGSGREAARGASGDDELSRRLDAEMAELSYEEALEQLEAIIERVEHGEIGLEATLDEYRRGRALLRRCQSVLDTAEQEIKRLSLADVEAGGRGEEPNA